MLNWKHIQDNEVEDGLRVELQRMLMLNMKAEIQIMDSYLGGLPRWLSQKLHG